MKQWYFYSSLTRISDLPGRAFSLESLPRKEWATGDYVVGEVVSAPNRFSRLELTSGRMVEVAEGDLIVGAFGVRYTTLEAVGGWQNIAHDRLMDVLTVFVRHTWGVFLAATAGLIIVVWELIQIALAGQFSSIFVYIGLAIIALAEHTCGYLLGRGEPVVQLATAIEEKTRKRSRGTHRERPPPGRRRSTGSRHRGFFRSPPGSYPTRRSPARCVDGLLPLRAL